MALESREVIDIIVLGAGPAGAVVAQRLARLGYRVAVIARMSRRGAVEGLSERAYTGLVHGGCRNALASAGAPVPRHAAWGGTARTVNAERLVDRDLFDAALFADLGQRRIPVFPGRPSSISESDGLWRITLSSPDTILRGHFLIEARGRQAPRTRVALRGPQTLAITRGFRDVRGTGPETVVESTPTGWLWAAFHEDGRAVVQAVTDGRAAAPDRDSLPALHDAHVAGSEIVRDRLAGALPSGTVRARDAGAVLMAELAGPAMIRVGDAAFAIDPLSGHGLYEAVGGAIAAATVVNTILSRPETGGIARRFYTSRAESAFLRHARVGRDFYRTEERWAAEPFWATRRRWPDDLPAHPSWSTAKATVQKAPVIVGDFVEERDVVVTPDQPRGVFVVDGVPLVPLLKLAGEAGMTPGLLAENLAASPQQVATALGWLRLRGLIPGDAPAP